MTLLTAAARWLFAIGLFLFAASPSLAHEVPTLAAGKRVRITAPTLSAEPVVGYSVPGRSSACATRGSITALLFIQPLDAGTSIG